MAKLEEAEPAVLVGRHGGLRQLVHAHLVRVGVGVRVRVRVSVRVRARVRVRANQG